MQADRWAIKNARREAGYTQKEMAKLLEMSIPTYLTKENNPDRFYFGELISVAEILELNINDLLKE